MLARNRYRFCTSLNTGPKTALDGLPENVRNDGCITAFHFSMDDDGSKSKKTVFVGGIAEEVDEAAIYQAFSTFG